MVQPVFRSPPANAEDVGSVSGLGRFHMPWGNQACKPQLLDPSAATTEASSPRACALQQEKPLQWEACALQQGATPTYHS